MSARCGFCSATLAEAPPGVAVRCAACGNVTIPSASSAGLPFSRVDGPKVGASPPPTIVLPSRAGGVDELIGGGITILGIGLVKFLLLSGGGLALFCILGMLGYAFHC